MPISQWSEDILVADLQDEPALSDEINALTERVQNDHSASGVVLNFQGVSYVNSSNLAQMLRLRKELSGQGGILRLCALNEQIWSVMLVSGLDRIFKFDPDTASSLAAIQLGVGDEDVEGSGDSDEDRQIQQEAGG